VATQAPPRLPERQVANGGLVPAPADVRRASVPPSAPAPARRAVAPANLREEEWDIPTFLRHSNGRDE
jgi:hypothetical protein